MDVEPYASVAMKRSLVSETHGCKPETHGHRSKSNRFITRERMKQVMIHKTREFCKLMSVGEAGWSEKFVRNWPDSRLKDLIKHLGLKDLRSGIMEE